MTLGNAEIIIGIMVALLASMISVYKIYIDAREKRFCVYVDSGWIGQPHCNRLLSFLIINHGASAVHIYQVGYRVPLYYHKLPKSFEGHFNTVFHRPWRMLGRIFPFYLRIGIDLLFYVQDAGIYTLQPNEKCIVNDEPEHLARQLRDIGFSGDVEIRGFCRDVTNRRFQAKPFYLNVGA